MTGFVSLSVSGVLSKPKSISWNIGTDVGAVGARGASSKSKSGGRGMSLCVVFDAFGAVG